MSDMSLPAEIKLASVVSLLARTTPPSAPEAESISLGIVSGDDPSKVKSPLLYSEKTLPPLPRHDEVSQMTAPVVFLTTPPTLSLLVPVTSTVPAPAARSKSLRILPLKFPDRV